MLDRIKSMRGNLARLGPMGSALAAAALTAGAFAAVSVAQNDGGPEGKQRADGEGPALFKHRAGPHPELSEEDRKAMEAFRSCMEEQDVDLPAHPGELEEGEMPEPPKRPSEADRERIEQAHEACEDELPEGAELRLRDCGHGPGDHGEDLSLREGRQSS